MTVLQTTLRCRTCCARNQVEGETLSALIAAMRALGWQVHDRCPDCAAAVMADAQASEARR